MTKDKKDTIRLSEQEINRRLLRVYELIFAAADRADVNKDDAQKEKEEGHE